MDKKREKKKALTTLTKETRALAIFIIFEKKWFRTNIGSIS